MDCIACGVEAEEEELNHVDHVGELCDHCYQDGITDSNTYLALYHVEKQWSKAKLYEQGYRGSHLQHRVDLKMSERNNQKEARIQELLSALKRYGWLPF